MLQGKGRGLSLLLVTLLSGCGDEKKDEPATPDTQTEALTYWDDMAPLFAEHCTSCHQEGGIAPFALDDYASAKPRAALIAALTKSREMPPWGATSDGSCQSFADDLSLSDEEITAIDRWVKDGAIEGKKRALTPREVPSLADALVFETPEFLPQAMGGALAEHDEYRCFLLDSGVTEPAFITAYDVQPGAPAIVHHSILMLVDPDGPADDPSLGTNLEAMQALDAESPDRAGWPCFSGAGEGVAVNASPVVWAPGQGVVEFPGQSGVPVTPRDKVVVQIHYNLADTEPTPDQTRIRLRTVPEVENLGLFVLSDPFLDSIFEQTPEMLAPGQASAKYQWQRSVEQLGLAELPSVTLRGVMPHMHELGQKYRMTLTDAGKQTCGVDVQSWDFHWQRMYFYDKPIALDADSSIGVTCDFDTRSKTEPVLPGWGTQNEMCLATLYVTVPLSELRQP